MEIVIGVSFFVVVVALIAKVHTSDHSQTSRPPHTERYHRPIVKSQYRPAPPPFNADTGRLIDAERTISGPAYVIDGDSLVIQRTQVRLFGVDAPELNHPFGKKSKWAMVTLCKGQVVTARIIARDAHGRTVAKCYLPDGRDLSKELVKQGLALDWPKYSGGIYGEVETQDARRKLWLADARQRGHMHVWAKFDAESKSRASKN